MGQVVGVLLAAGAGRRMGKPKALVTGENSVPWVVSSVQTLLDGGCSEVLVVIGAEAAQVRELLTDLPVEIVEAADWAEGMGASLRAGLAALQGRDLEAVLIHLVDLPDVGAEVIQRVLAQASPEVLCRAVYASRPSHPVLLGSAHLAAIYEDLAGDEGARGYLARSKVAEVECGDLAGGRDIDFY